jgi:hypothetical protein
MAAKLPAGSAHWLLWPAGCVLDGSGIKLAALAENDAR